MSGSRKYRGALLVRGVGLVFESGWPVAQVVADRGIDAERLRRRVRRAEAAGGKRGELLTREGRERIGRLRRENFELRRAIAILEAASVFFASLSV